LAASSVIKSIEHAEQSLNKLSPAELAENNPSRFYKTADINQVLTYCARFEVDSNDATITPLIAKIETEAYSHVEVFSANVCPPKKLDPSKYSTPMIQYVADDSENRYNFPNEIYKYLEKHGDKSGWLQIINAKNSKGMTYLDYVKYVYKKKPKMMT